MLASRHTAWIVTLVAAVLLLAASSLLRNALADEAAWERLRDGGHVVLIRHARAPGTGDPPGFRLEDCATQRNLSAEGRAQAAALGEAFRSRDIPVGRVLSSRWCRALDTAELAFGTVEPFPPLDSFLRDRALAEERIETVQALIRDWPADGSNLVLVTHQVNITALTDIFPAEGEILVVRANDDSEIAVVGRIAAPP